jgi:DHA1 family multidrug resistance protein-like MFS transporter
LSGSSVKEQGVGRQPHWIWLLFLFTYAGFIEAVFYGQMSAFTPLYLPQLGVGKADVAAWTGVIVTISSLVGIPFLPMWGALADRYARQPIIVRSYLVHFIAGVVSLMAGNVWVFVIGRSIMSFSLGNSGLMMTTLSERAPSQRQGLAFSIMSSAAPVGAFVGPLLGGPVVDHWGFRTLLGIDAALMLVVMVALTFGYRDTYKASSQGSLLRMSAESVNLILRSPRLRTLFPALILLFAGWLLAFTYVPLAVATFYPGDTQGSMVGLIMGIGGLAALILSPVIGALGDRYGLWRVLFLAASLEVILWPLPFFTRGLFSFGLMWTVINGVASGVFAISFSVLAKSTTTQTRGRVMAFAYLPLNIGSVLGPAIGSLITQQSVFPVFPFAAVLTAAGLGALFYSSHQSVEGAFSS